MAEISFEQVTKVYPDGTEAVHEVDLGIDDGSLMVLVGPSGCGKTTMLRMVAGLEEITDGTIRIGDRVINDVDAKNRDLAWAWMANLMKQGVQDRVPAMMSLTPGRTSS